jgi:hypothetical protein
MASKWMLQYIRLVAPLFPRDKLAVVFDIDDTVLLYTGQVIFPMLQVFREALKHNVHVFFVTARPEDPDNREITEAQLKVNNFVGYDKLYMMPTEMWRAGLCAKYKAGCREKIASSFRIFLNAGDMAWDLSRNPNIVDAVDNLAYDSAYIVSDPEDPAAISVKLPERPHKEKDEVEDEYDSDGELVPGEILKDL